MHCRVVTNKRVINGEKDRLCTQPSCCDSATPVRSKMAITILAKARYELEGEKHTIELVNDAAVYQPHMTQGTLSPKRDRHDVQSKQTKPNSSDKDTEKNRHSSHSLSVSSRSGHSQACSLFMKIARLPPCRNCKKKRDSGCQFLMSQPSPY